MGKRWAVSARAPSTSPFLGIGENQRTGRRRMMFWCSQGLDEIEALNLWVEGSLGTQAWFLDSLRFLRSVALQSRAPRSTFRLVRVQNQRATSNGRRPFGHEFWFSPPDPRLQVLLAEFGYMPFLSRFRNSRHAGAAILKSADGFLFMQHCEFVSHL